jgi:hypothetical protein
MHPHIPEDSMDYIYDQIPLFPQFVWVSSAHINIATGNERNFIDSDFPDQDRGGSFDEP